MDWLILILGIPAILIPLVLLFGFAGCCPVAAICTNDQDCPGGTQCFDGSCALAGEPSLSAPKDLAAIAHDDHSVSLTWTNTDPAATDFLIERAPDDGENPQPVSPSGTISPAGTIDDSAGLQEGLTFVYRVRARADGFSTSVPSDNSSATVLPTTPVSFTATVASLNQIDLSWTNASTVATEFSLERRDLPGGAFAPIGPNPLTATTFSDTSGLVEGTTYEYRVFAVINGFENNAQQTVQSLPAVVSTTLAFTAAFTAPPGTLGAETRLQGFCVVQRLSPTLLAGAGNQVRNQVRIVLSGSATSSLTIDKIAISQVGTTGDPYDAAVDRTDVASGVTIPQNTTLTVGPVNYRLDPTQDLLVAFDISAGGGVAGGNGRFGTLSGADAFTNAATAEAGVQDRTTGYTSVPATLLLIEKIEVL
jgi:hypothetical protein